MLAALLAASGIHQPAEWRKSRFRSIAQTILLTSRLKRLHAAAAAELGAASPGSAAAQEEEGGRRRREGKSAALLRLRHSHLEEPTFITHVLRAVDPAMLDDTPGTVNTLTRRGIAFVTLCSTLGFHLLRLLLRDTLFDAILTRTRRSRGMLMKTRITEVYLLSAIHALACAAFSLRKILSGRWDCPSGSESMLCFSLGYTSYSILALRSQLLVDPMFALSEGANFVKIVSCLSSRGVRWIVPLLMSAEVPTACLNILRMMAELGTLPSSLAWRIALGAFTTSFAAIKGIALPATIIHIFSRRAKEWPELHQPNFLPAKLALLLRIALNYAWLSVVARHWIPTAAAASSGSARQQQALAHRHLPRLRDLTAKGGLLQVANPLSLLYFLIVQSGYFVGPAALPAMLYALARKPRYRMAAGSGLATLALLTFWPMKLDRPYRDKPVEASQVDPMGRFVRSYFSFKSVFEEPLQRDRRYLLAMMPHGVMPYACTCLASQLLEQGLVPNIVGADVLLRIPFLRQLCRRAGVIPASTQSIRRALKWPYPNNVTFIVPGGIAEIFYMRQDLEQVLIKRRKGFVKLALQAGADLVPVYGLGHTHVFTTLDRSSFIGSLLMRLSRRLQISLPLSYGRWGMPLIPYSKPIAALVGRPIRVDEAVAEPSQELIDEVHGRFVEEVRRIFEKHKHVVPGYANKRLYFDDEEVPGLPKDPVASDHLFPSSLPSFGSRL